MKVHFIIPPSLTGKPHAERVFGCNYSLHSLPNIFVLYPATFLKNNGYDVEVTDCINDGYGAPETFYEFAEKDRSDIFVFYSVFLTRETDKRASDFALEKHPEARCIFIGSDPTYNPINYLDRNGKFIVRGEPEFALLELVNALRDGKSLARIKEIKGISFFNDGNIVENPSREPIWDLDSLPMPERALVKNPQMYEIPKLKHPATIILTSRNCYAQCKYCVPCSLSFARELEYKKDNECKPRPTMHSAKRVIEEFKEISRMGYKSVGIIDDNFTMDRQRVKEICRGIMGLKLSWTCLSRADNLNDDEMLELMKQAGCKSVDIGVESFNQEILDDIRKGMKVEIVEPVLSKLNSHGISVQFNILLGASPLETDKTIENTLTKARELSRKYNIRYIFFNVCSPFPGTEFYYEAKKNGWMIYDEYQPTDGTRESQISYPHLSKERLEYWLHKAYRDQYFSPRGILMQLGSIRSFYDLKYKIKTALKMYDIHFNKK